MLRPTHLTCITLMMLAAAAAGCGRKDEPPKSPPTMTSSEAPPEASQPVGNGELAGTSWRLVKIMSMDDSTYTPDDPSVYTLAFEPDGTARIQADCNRGTGEWSAESASQLRFGVIAATQAECPPGSLHARYMKQFEWVRSYVLEDGRLFLATMADGSIIEFEPVQSRP
jgi:heat shock protein HslJ